MRSASTDLGALQPLLVPSVTCNAYGTPAGGKATQ